MAWRIDRDYIDGGTPESAVGTAQWANMGHRGANGGEPDPSTLTFRFRLRDEDGEIHYGGAYDAAAAGDDDHEDDDEGGLYQAAKWGEVYSGAVILEVKGEEWASLCGGDGQFAIDNADEDGWYIPYG